MVEGDNMKKILSIVTIVGVLIGVPTLSARLLYESSPKAASWVTYSHLS